MFFTVGGKRWRFLAKQRMRDLGQCDAPDTPNKSIRIRRGLAPLTELDTILHETLHAGAWNLAEDEVEKIATAQALLLIRLGWRPPE